MEKGCNFKCAYADELGRCMCMKGKYCEINYGCLYKGECVACVASGCYAREPMTKLAKAVK